MSVSYYIWDIDPAVLFEDGDASFYATERRDGRN